MGRSPPLQLAPAHNYLNRLWGNPSHLNHLRDRLRQEYPDDKLHILVAKTNANNHTYDGIEVGGERIVYEVEQEIARLEVEHGTKIEKISVAGYSLGEQDGLAYKWFCTANSGLLQAYS